MGFHADCGGLRTRMSLFGDASGVCSLVCVAWRVCCCELFLCAWVGWPQGPVYIQVWWCSTRAQTARAAAAPDVCLNSVLYYHSMSMGGGGGRGVFVGVSCWVLSRHCARHSVGSSLG